jgi:hypothetical protein
MSHTVWIKNAQSCADRQVSDYVLRNFTWRVCYIRKYLFIGLHRRSVANPNLCSGQTPQLW